MNVRTLLRTTGIALVPLIGALTAPVYAHDSGDDGGEQNPVETLVCSVDDSREGCAPAGEPAPAEPARAR